MRSTSVRFWAPLLAGGLPLALGSVGLLVADASETGDGRLALRVVTAVWILTWTALVVVGVGALRVVATRHQSAEILVAVSAAQQAVLRDQDAREAVVDAVITVTGAALCILTERDGDVLSATASAGASIPELRLPLDGPSLSVRVFHSGRSTRVLNILDEPDAAPAAVHAFEQLLGCRLHSVACVPVVVGGTVVGTLAAAFAATNIDLAERAVSILEILGAEAAIGIEREQTTQALQAQDRWRASLMATLAHDIRSPLTSIVGALDLLEDDPQTAAHHLPFVRAASRQSGRILRLANGLLDVERVESGQLRLDRRRVDVAGLAAQVAALARGEVVVEVPEALVVRMDPERLEQIVTNLVDNALRHGIGPVVVGAGLAASGGPRDLEITVRDHGAGVPPERADRLFEKFGSPRPTAGSTGLGLWIVQLLAEAHGGRVTYESAEPGARFTVTVPGALVAVGRADAATSGRGGAAPDVVARIPA